MHVRSAILGLILATATSSCAFLLDFDELQGGPAPASVPLEQAPEAYADALCDRLERCVGALAKYAIGAEDCRDYLTKFLGQSVLAELSALPPDTFAYHADKMPACLDAVREADCTVVSPIPEACDAAITGLVTQDGACTHPAQCTRGLYCNVASGSCPGSCQPRPSEGQPCANGACLEGLQCDDSLDQCVRARVEGEQCEGGQFGSCRLDMTCLGKADQTPGTCRPNEGLYTQGDGVGCNWSKGGLCKAGFCCELESAAKAQAGDYSGTCVSEVAAGSPCKLALPDACAAGHYCKVTAGIDGKCEPLPTPGEDCAVLSLVALCAAGARCTGRNDAAPSLQPGTCVALAALGYGCSGDATCFSGHCQDGKCAAPNFCPSGG